MDSIGARLRRLGILSASLKKVIGRNHFPDLYLGTLLNESMVMLKIWS